MGSWFSSNRVTEVDPLALQWEKVSEDKPVSIYSHDKSYLVTVEQGERHYQLHKSKKLQDAKLSAEQLKGKLKDLLHLVHISESSELETLLEHSKKNPSHSVLQSVCHLNMFNKFSDGLSGLKTYVNSPALGRNQVPLHIAVKSNTAFAVNQLLNAGGDPLAKDEAGNNPVHAAAFSGCYIALEAILAHETVNRNGIKEDVLTSTNNEGDTPLHLACKGTIEYYLLLKIQSQVVNQKMRPSDAAIAKVIKRVSPRESPRVSPMPRRKVSEAANKPVDKPADKPADKQTNVQTNRGLSEGTVLGQTDGTKEAIQVTDQSDKPTSTTDRNYIAPQVGCIDLLLDHGSRYDTPNVEGYRPIQCAVMSLHADVHAIDKLLEHDPSQVEVIDGEGNGLLHHAKGQKVIQCLVHHGVDTAKLNNKGQTALHKVVSEEGATNPLDQLTALLLNGVPVDLLNSNGDTALHCLARLPAKKGSNREFMIKALVILGADLNQRNEGGMTVYDIAKKESCRSTMTLLAAVGADDRKYLDCKQYPPISKELLDDASSDKVPRKRGNWEKNNAAVLALDGGGIRGLVLVQMLLDLERRSNLQITQLFDWIGGTSTGSMLTLGMIYADMGLRDVQQLYFSLKDEIFQGSRPYNTEILENFMKTKFSESGVMSSRQFPRCVVPATIADCRPCKLHVFKNYGFRSENDLPPPHLQKIWEATRGSSAAPTYFTPHKRFVDGGLMANNPTITILTEMHECNQDPGKLGYSEAAAPVTFTEGLMRAVVGENFSTREQDNNGVGFIESRPVEQGSELVKNVEQEPTKPYVVVSFGTGLAPEVFVKDYNVSKVEGPLGAGRFLLGVKEFAETLVEQCAATDGAVVMGAKAWCESIGSYYFRLQPQMSYNMKMDETDNKNLVECLWDVQCFIYQHKDQFAKMTDLLMSAF